MKWLIVFRNWIEVLLYDVECCQIGTFHEDGVRLTDSQALTSVLDQRFRQWVGDILIHWLYDPIIGLIVLLINNAGNLRSEGHGTYTYMWGRVVEDVFEKSQICLTTQHKDRPRYKWDCKACEFDGLWEEMDRYLSCDTVEFATAHKYVFVYGDKPAEYVTSDDKYYRLPCVSLDKVFENNEWR